MQHIVRIALRNANGFSSDSRQTDETYGITDPVLANGVRVLLKPTAFMEEEVLFSAASPGGSSLNP